jgi:hypothetical protein
MVKTTRAQREALFKVFQRDFPSWVSPVVRRKYNAAGNVLEDLVLVPSIQYRRFRKQAQGGPDCIMLPWRGMWLGIEPDGYTHS